MSKVLAADTQQPVALSTSGPARRMLWIWIAVSAAALLLRIALLPMAPGSGYPADHDDFVRWGIQATDEGLLSLYDKPPPRWNLRVGHDGHWQIIQREMDRLCNYPPLSAYLLWGCGHVFKLINSDRLINTVTSRSIFASYSIVCDFLLAASCAALVYHFRPGRAALWTYAIVLFIPPFWWDTIIWGQVDSTIMAPIVWCIWAMVRHKWVLAGVLYGAAAMLKPQAVILAPVWVYALVFTCPFRKILSSLAAALLTIAVISLPFTLHSGLAWLRSCYIQNILHENPATTLKAFNLWYADLLWCDSLDVGVKVLGLTKDLWGKILLLGGVAAGFLYIGRRWKGDGRGVILFAEWTLLCSVILPTRVHERYLLLALPLLIVAAMKWRRFWPSVAVFVVVAMAQITWPMWLAVQPKGRPQDVRWPAGTWPGIELQTTERYKAMTPQQQSRAPRLSDILARQHEQYQAIRSRTVSYEWLYVSLALASAAYVALVTATLQPQTKPTTTTTKNR